MIFIEAKQGTPEWLKARCGMPTASRFGDAVSMVGGLNDQQTKYVALCLAGAAEKDAALDAGYKAVPNSNIIRRALAGEETREASDIAKRYAADIAIEQISGVPGGEPMKVWVMERGHEMETKARMAYEARTKSFVTESGICVTEDRLFGYSSDGLVDDDGLIEVKAPIDGTKILDMWRDGDTSEYDHQMQGGMWITGRKWCDFLMYVPALANCGKDLYIKRVFRDEQFIDDMVTNLMRFQKIVEANVALLRGPL